VDAAALAKCLAAYQQSATDCDENTLLASCVGVFMGTKGSGEACTNAYECKRDQGPMTCLFAVAASVGSCKPVPHGKADEACLDTCPSGTDCSSVTAGAADTNITLCFESDHLYCDILSSNPVCKALLATGDACTSDAACGSTGTCNTKCQASATLNEPCGAGCRPDLVCSTDGKCEDPSLANGAVCTGYPPARANSWGVINRFPSPW
jgi:hypothetical protein